MKELSVAVAICIAFAALTRLVVGTGVRGRVFGLHRLFSDEEEPSTIEVGCWWGFSILYYSMCCVTLYRLLSTSPHRAMRPAGFAMLITMMGVNALLSYLFWRRESLRATSIMQMPYTVLVLALVVVLVGMDALSAVLVGVYAARQVFDAISCVRYLNDPWDLRGGSVT